MKLLKKQQIHTSSRAQGGWWCDGHIILYVDKDKEYTSPVYICTYSDATTYYIKVMKE